MKHFLRTVLMIGVSVSLFGADPLPSQAPQHSSTINPRESFVQLEKDEVEMLLEVGRPKDDTHTAINEAVGALIAGLEGADRIEVFRGLPREIWNGSEFEPGKKPEACREIAGQWFYAEPRSVEPKDLPELKRMFKNGLVERWRGLKLCGGFHADYALVVTKGKTTFYIPTCLGCHEARLIRETPPAGSNPATPDFRVLVDLGNEMVQPWVKWLNAYDKERRAK